MIINPRTAIAEGWIQGDITEDNIQPNGIDFTADKLYCLANDDSTKFKLGFDTKRHAKWFEMTPLIEEHGAEGLLPSWRLLCHEIYDFQSTLRVTLPADGVSALLIGRSTLNRNGLFITSGWYDSNFDGQISGMLRTSNVPAVIAKGARIGQIIFFESDAAKAYNGQYQGNAGHWTETVK